jgi:DNA primase catalytic core
MAVRDDQKMEVQQATDIVSLVAEQIALRQKGKDFAGLCPFHEDKNPSMYVVPHKQIYHCFVCGASGDVFSWMMNYHKLSFPEALKALAERANITLVPVRGAARHAEQKSRNEKLREANVQGLAYFQHMFGLSEQGQVARDYIEQRGISAEMIDTFQIGYAPDDWEKLVGVINKKNWSLADFAQVGLVKPRKQGNGHYDALRHRVIFPIWDELGKPIAFGARKIREEDEPKYLNSPDTPLFNKSQTLYGLHHAKQAIINSRTAVVVEGYTDVIACHQAKATNVIATLGTALTSEHIRLLKKFCDRTVLIFDADVAGQKAADRAVEIFLSENVDVAIASVPGGKDPADLMLLPDGKAMWDTAIADAIDALTYMFSRLEANLKGEDTITGRQRIAETFIQRVAGLGIEKAGAIRRAFVIQKLMGLLHVTESQVEKLLRDFAPRAPRVHGGKDSNSPASKASRAPAKSGGSSVFGTDLAPASPVTTQFSEIDVENVEFVPSPKTSTATSVPKTDSSPRQQDASPDVVESPACAASDIEPGFDPLNEAELVFDADGNPVGQANDSVEISLDDQLMNGEVSPFSDADSDISTDTERNTQNKSVLDVESVTVVPKIATVRAEKQLIGCLIRQPGLFHQVTLSDGQALDEALTPSEMITSQGRELYQLMVDLFVDGQPVSLAGLLGEFAQMQRQDLADFVTEADELIDGIVGVDEISIENHHATANANEDGLGDMDENNASQAGPTDPSRNSSQSVSIDIKAANVADVLVSHHREAEYQMKTRLAATDISAQDSELRKAIEFKKMHRSSLSIMRPQDG